MRMGEDAPILQPDSAALYPLSLGQRTKGLSYRTSARKFRDSVPPVIP